MNNVRTDAIVGSEMRHCQESIHNVRTYKAAEKVLMFAESLLAGAEQLHKVLPVLKCIIHYIQGHTWLVCDHSYRLI